MENAFIESFNGRFREECLDEHCLFDLKDAREKIEAWRRDYNTSRPPTVYRVASTTGDQDRVIDAVHRQSGELHVSGNQ